MGKTSFIVGGHNVIRYSDKNNKPHSYYVECYSGAKRLMIKCTKWFQVNNLVNSKAYNATAPQAVAVPTPASNTTTSSAPVKKKAVAKAKTATKKAAKK